MGAQKIGSRNLLELLHNQFSQKEVLCGNGRDFQNFKLPPFMFSIIERSRLDKIRNEPILERRIITLKIFIKNFLILMNFLRPHFKLNVLEGDMVSFTEAFLLLAREGGAKILNTLYAPSQSIRNVMYFLNHLSLMSIAI